jgi:glycosyltransferase involved in cell wall biosynthesis
MKPLRIVLVLTDPPLPFGNAAARWYYVLLRGLVERGHRVTALAACGRAEDVAKARSLFPADRFDLQCYAMRESRGLWPKWKTLCEPYGYVFSPALRRDLGAELAAGYDVLHLEQLWSGWLGVRHARRALVNIHYLFSIDLAETSAASITQAAIRAVTLRAEKTLLRRYGTICTLTPRLTENVQRISPGSSVHTVPLGIDLSLYPFCQRRPSGRPPVVGLIGSFNWAPSRSAGVRLLSRLWPEIKRRVPQARLQIVGRDARKAFSDHLALPDATILENVPKILPYFESSDVLLYAPERGSGMKVKVLEAFAMGVPVVTNADGAEGLPAVDGVHAEIGRSDHELVERTVALLVDHERRQWMCEAARKLVETHCSPERALDAVERRYTALTRHRPGVAA